MKNWQRSGRLAAVILLAVSVTGCIVLPLGSGRGHRGHHYSGHAEGAAAHPRATQGPAATWQTPAPHRGR